MKMRNVPFVVLIIVGFVAVVFACSQSQAQAPVTEAEQLQVNQPADVDAGHEEAEEEEGDHGHAEAERGHAPGEQMAGAHDVPAEAAAVENPIPANDGAIAAGAAIYAQNCTVCHGEAGEGDGPAAPTLPMKPANLHETHVQELSDGALHWIISHGVEGTPMPPWNNVLTEEQRWQVVNFLRTFGDGAEEVHVDEGHTHSGAAADHHDDDGGDEHPHTDDAAGDGHHHDDDGHTH